jgi:hypothetical protein
VYYTWPFGPFYLLLYEFDSIIVIQCILQKVALNQMDILNTPRSTVPSAAVHLATTIKLPHQIKGLTCFIQLQLNFKRFISFDTLHRRNYFAPNTGTQGSWRYLW